MVARQLWHLCRALGQPAVATLYLARLRQPCTPPSSWPAPAGVRAGLLGSLGAQQRPAQSTRRGRLAE
eukprot:13734967-Alexandrium_andersonii.AAC.1